MPPIKTFGERIADVLVEDGLLFRKQFEELLEQQKREGTRPLKIIIGKAYVTEQDMAVSMGRVLNPPPVNLGRRSVQHPAHGNGHVLLRDVGLVDDDLEEAGAFPLLLFE